MSMGPHDTPGDVLPDQVTDIDLLDPATQEDWFPTYRRLRDEAPVYRMPGTSIYVLTRYEDVMWVIRHPDRFPNGYATIRHESARKIYQKQGFPKGTVLGTNPPEHRKFRALVDPHFSLEGSERWVSRIEALAHHLVDQFSADGQVEFVSSFALPLPVTMITVILGLPLDDLEQLKAWSEAWVLPFSGPLSEDQENWVAEQGVAFQNYILDHLRERRANPQDDVISHLAQAVYDGERLLTDSEIVRIVDHLYIGGNETTTFALTSALWILLREPGLYERLTGDRGLVEPFIEEVLRLESPTQGLYRITTRDEELHGVAIPEGSTIHIRYAAANRDERIFANPAEVDLERSNLKRHMAFSLGEHHCPGSGLSRTEQRIALNVVLDRLPGLALDHNRNDYTHLPGLVLRALRELHVTFTPSEPTGRSA